MAIPTTELLLKGLRGAWNKRRASGFNTTRIDHLYQDRTGDPRLVLLQRSH